MHKAKPIRRRSLRRVALRAAVILSLLFVLAAVGFFVGLRSFESMVTFHPEHARDTEWKVPPGYEEVWFKTVDGVRLNGWFVASQGQRAGTIVYFHGNAGNISNGAWIGQTLATGGFDVLLFDYRGYGRSEGRLSNEDELYDDATAAYEYAREKGEASRTIFLYGESLGTTAAIDLARRKPCAALVVEAGLSSASDMAGSMLPWLPAWLHLMGRNRFDSARKLPSIHCPVLIVHGDLDETIPVEHARRLYAAANPPKQLRVLAGANHNISGFGGKAYLREVTDFMRSVAAGKVPD